MDPVAYILNKADVGRAIKIVWCCRTIFVVRFLSLVWHQLNASDLRPIYQHVVFKYADDTDLVVPNMFSFTIPQELQHISDWAKHYNLKLNQTKSLEIIISLQIFQHILQQLIP